MLDWQIIPVILIVFAAVIFAGHRAWLKFRGLSDSSCATGCGKCVSETDSSKLSAQIKRR